MSSPPMSPAPPMSLGQALDDLAGAAAFLERGQADTPLCEEIERIVALRGAAPLAVALIATDDALRARALSWVLGEADAGGIPLGAVREAAAGPDRLAIRVTAIDPAQPPADGGFRLVVDAVRAGQEPDSAQTSASERLARDGAFVWRLAFRLEGDGVARPRAAAADAPLPSLVIGPDLTPASNLSRGASAGDVRRLLATLLQARRGLAAAEMIRDRQQTEIRQLQARQKREQEAVRPDAATPTEAENRPQFDQLRARVGEEMNRLAADLREQGRRANLKAGDTHGLVEELLANLRDDDLAQEPVGKKIRLSLKAEVTEDLRSRFAEVLRDMIQSDAGRVAEASATVSAILDEAGAAGAARLRLDAATITDLLWPPIEDGLHLQVRYRGEMRRRGFFQRLGEGRRFLFVILMAGSLVGGFMGFNVRRNAALGPLFLVIFVASVGYTFYSWRAEEKLSLDDELVRLRDLLGPEFSRLLADALRERQSRLQGLTEEVRRAALAEVDGLQRLGSSVRAKTADADRKAARVRLKVVEDQLREVQGMNPTLVRTRGALERATAEGRRELGAVCLGRPAAPVARPVG